MSYSSVESALLTVLQLHADYSTANSSAGDYRVLAASSARSVILSPGPFAREVVAAPRRVRNAWVINLDLFVPFRIDLSTVAAAIRTDRQTILDHLDKYPTLNSATGVLNAFCTGAGEPEEWVGEDGGFWSQRLVVQVEERVIVTIAE